VEIHEQGCTALDYTALLQDTTEEHLLYLDPPYYHKGNDMYQCGFSEEDHQKLAKLLKDSPPNWVLSYDDCEEIHQLYGEWTHIEIIENISSISGVKDKESGQKFCEKKQELLIYP
jgi:DNA adenine methylase